MWKEQPIPPACGLWFARGPLRHFLPTPGGAQHRRGWQGLSVLPKGAFCDSAVTLPGMLQETSTGMGGEGAAGQASEALASLLQVHPLLPHPLHVLQRLFHSHQSRELNARGGPAPGGAQRPVLLVSGHGTWVGGCRAHSVSQAGKMCS